MKTTRLRVTLREVTPVVQRVIDVPAAITLDELHEVLQIALGWTDSHLHQYRTDSAVYSMPLDDWCADGEEEPDERGVRLSSLPPRLAYLYDFGDGWTHDVEMLGPGGDAPGCIDGEGACPPEDCGGPGGYAELLVTRWPTRGIPSTRRWLSGSATGCAPSTSRRPTGGCATRSAKSRRASGCCSTCWPPHGGR